MQNQPFNFCYHSKTCIINTRGFRYRFTLNGFLYCCKGIWN